MKTQTKVSESITLACLRLEELIDANSERGRRDEVHGCPIRSFHL